MNLTKKQAQEKIEELQNHIKSLDEKKGYVIKNRYDNSEIYVSKADNVRDAVIEAVKARADLWGADLWKADLREANLREANLREANLREANLRGVNLRGADLWKADLRKADLWGADLWEADLREADLREANLENVKFYGKGGTQKLTKKQVPVFLKALGFEIE